MKGAGAVLLALTAGMTASSAMQGPPDAAPAPPVERRVALPDGRALRLVCEGRGTPVVMFEGGWQAGADAAAGIRRRVAETTTACSYDRAGYFGSDPGPMPRDAGAEAADLAALLRAAKLAPPYVFVAHSLGGLVVRAYAARPDARVAAMLLLDPSVPRQTALLGRALPAYGAKMAGWESGMAGCADGRAPCRKGLTPTLASEIATMGGASSDAVERGPAGYGAMPLVVLTAGRSMIPDAPPPVQAMLDGAWRDAHAAIAARSTQGQHRVLADTGHLIPKERPELVAAAARLLVEAVRARRPLAPLAM